MTALAPSTGMAADETASACFHDALCRVFPGCYPAEVQSVTLIALLDDGSLATVAGLGPSVPEREGRSLWSDAGWQELARLSQHWPVSEVVTRPDRTLIPVMCGPVLYGAIDWRGPTPVTTLPDDAQCRARDEFLDSLIERIDAGSRVART